MRRRPVDSVTVTYMLALAVVVIVAYAPLSQYGFAQDDFILIDQVWRSPVESVVQFFQPEPGHFRPLTKGVYFIAMHRVFDVDAFPYHLISLLLHLVNACLVVWLMRVLGLQRTPALVAATFFALSVAFFHVLAWVSCIQQLAGQMFVLLALIFGVEAVRRRTGAWRYASIAAYVAALLSLEQAAALPVVLCTAVMLVRRTESLPLREGVRELWPHFAIMAGYIVMMAAWRGTPHEGPYVPVVGLNVVENLSTYLGWMMHYAVDFPLSTNVGAPGLSKGHVALIALAGFHVAGGSWREVVFAALYVVAMLGPALVLVDHTAYMHTYMPSAGVVFLIGLAVQDMLHHGRLVRRGRVVGRLVLGAVLVVMGTLAYTMTRHNIADRMMGIADLSESFVIRRAEIAANVRRSITSSPRFQARQRSPAIVHLIYARPTGGERATWNARNVAAAIGEGSAIRLFYGDPNLEVKLWLPGETPPPPDEMTGHVYLFDDVGHCFSSAVSPR